MNTFQSILVVILQPLLELATTLFVGFHYPASAALTSQHDERAAEDQEQIDDQVHDDKSDRDISK